MTIALPARKVDQLSRAVGRVAGGTADSNGEGSVGISRKLQYASFVIRPGWYFVHRLLQVPNVPCNGDERAGEGGAWGWFRKQNRNEGSFTVVEGIHGICGLVDVVSGQRGGVRGRDNNSASFQLREAVAE